MSRHVRLALLIVWAGSWEIGATPAETTRLGLPEVRVIETAEHTTIVGVDGEGWAVARIDLIHGRFVPTQDFGPEYQGREVDGRKLTVSVKGQRLEWQTLGYTDTRHMPALPPSMALVAAFVTDARVRPLLEKWKIGWMDGATTTFPCFTPDGVPTTCDAAGTNLTYCFSRDGNPTHLSCPIAAGVTEACAGAPSTQALVVKQDLATFGWDQDVVFMCCVPFGSLPAYRIKTCAVAPAPQPPPGSPPPPPGTCQPGHFCSSCGDSGTMAKCAPCSLVVPATTSCSLTALSAGYVNQAGEPVYNVCNPFSGEPPVITIAGANPLAFECHTGAYADPGASATEACGADDLTASITVSSSVDPDVVGSYAVRYDVADSVGKTATATRTVVVADTTPPIITARSPIQMWPPNHEMRSFTLADCASASDTCAAVNINAAGTIASISSNEGGAADYAITGTSSFALRADRDGNGTGRVYTIGFTVSDPSGNSSVGSCRILVPHDSVATTRKR